MTVPIVTIFGGSGFIGRYVAQRMARAGWRVRVAVRRPDEAYFVRPYGVVGQVEPIQANIRDEASTRRAIAGADAVVNCVGVLAEAGRADLRGADARGRRPDRPDRRRGGRARGWCTSRRSAPTPTATAATPRAKGRGEAAVRAAFPARGDPAALDRLRDRGPVLQPLRARWRGCRRCCRWSAPRPGSSRSTSTTSPPPRRPRRSGDVEPGSTSSAARRSATFRELMQRMLGDHPAPPADRRAAAAGWRGWSAGSPTSRRG